MEEQIQKKDESESPIQQSETIRRERLKKAILRKRDAKEPLNEEESKFLGEEYEREQEENRADIQKTIKRF
jgi:hypothetical protein